MKIKIYTDGAPRGNPGKAGAGAVVYKDNKELFSLRKFLGIKTNNYAEYMALICALQELTKTNEYKKAKVEVYADSKLLIEQANGNWKVKNENIKPLFAELMNLVKEFRDISFTHIPRAENSKADALANEAIDNFN